MYFGWVFTICKQFFLSTWVEWTNIKFTENSSVWLTQFFGKETQWTLWLLSRWMLQHWGFLPSLDFGKCKVIHVCLFFWAFNSSMLKTVLFTLKVHVTCNSKVMQQLKSKETFYVLAIYLYNCFSNLIFLRNCPKQDRLYLCEKNINTLFQVLWNIF